MNIIMVDDETAEEVNYHLNEAENELIKAEEQLCSLANSLEEFEIELFRIECLSNELRGI